jgi:hypothetical protein
LEFAGNADVAVGLKTLQDISDCFTPSPAVRIRGAQRRARIEGSSPAVRDPDHANPNRFKQVAPTPTALPSAAWINPPKQNLASTKRTEIAL